MSHAVIRIASPQEFPKLREAYLGWGYHAGIADEDRVYVAECGVAVAGVVRRTCEHGVTMLRGMQVAPARQRQGIGRAVLQAFVRDLPGKVCYCIPYAHLVGFYGSVGFQPDAEEDVPSFLRARLAGYRADGLDVLVMCRRPVDVDPHPAG